MIELTVSEPTAIELEVVEAAIKPEVTGHVTPKYSAQTVYPAAGTVFGSVEVDPIPDPTDVKEIDANGDHDVRRYGTARVNVPIPPGYVLPTGSLDITENADGIDVTEKASVNINVPIPPEYIIPTGTKTITQNGTGIDISQYAEADVTVPQGVFPTGTKQITANGTGIDVTNFAAVDVAVPTPSMPEEYSIGGSLLARTLTGYHFGNGVTRLENRIFENCTNLNVDALPDTITYIGQYSFSGCSVLSINSLPSSLAEIQPYAFYNCISLAITQVPSGVTAIYSASFRGCTSLTSIEFLGNISQIQTQAFYNDANILRYVFSHNTAVPTLQNANAFNNINANCKIVVPDNLVSAWKTATNWNTYADKIIGASDI